VLLPSSRDSVMYTRGKVRARGGGRGRHRGGSLFVELQQTRSSMRGRPPFLLVETSSPLLLGRRPDLHSARRPLTALSLLVRA